MDERVYVTATIPYGELTHGVADPRGARRMATPLGFGDSPLGGSPAAFAPLG